MTDNNIKVGVVSGDFNKGAGLQSYNGDSNTTSQQEESSEQQPSQNSEQ